MCPGCDRPIECIEHRWSLVGLDRYSRLEGSEFGHKWTGARGGTRGGRAWLVERYGLGGMAGGIEQRH